MSVAAQLRRLWLNVHLWLGVGLFLPLVLVGLSGSVLTFQGEFDRYVHPGRYHVGDSALVRPSQLLNAAQQAAGDGFAIASVRFPDAVGQPAVAIARAKGPPVEGRPPQSRRIYLDPSNARVLDIENPRAGLFGVLHQLHGSLLIPDVGRKVVGWIGWGMLMSSLTGIWLWWPRSAFWKGFAWRRGPIFSLNLHHLLGFWIAVPLAVLSATGVYISFPQSARALTLWVTHEQTPPQQRGEGAGQQRGGAQLIRTHLTIDEAAEIARTSAPRARLAALTLPTRPRSDAAPAWRAELRHEVAKQNLQLTISDADGAVTRGMGGGLEGPALLMRRLHDGVDQALWWRIVIFIGGLAPAILGVTGLIIWLRGTAIKRAAKM